MPLKASDIRRLFELLDEELRKSDTRAELFLVGGGNVLGSASRRKPFMHLRSCCRQHSG